MSSHAIKVLQFVPALQCSPVRHAVAQHYWAAGHQVLPLEHEQVGVVQSGNTSLVNSDWLWYSFSKLE
jgi:hypothetical protein